MSRLMNKAPHMSPTTRRILFAVGAASAAVMVLSGGLMAWRIGSFHKNNQRAVFAFQELALRSFEYAGRPVDLTDEDEAGIWYLRLTYGDATERLPVAVPGDRRLPGLMPHAGWLRVLRFAEADGKKLDELQAQMRAGEVRDRLVAVTRSPRPGQDPLTYGNADPRGWVFDFYEFKPEGGFEHERLRFPTTKTHQAARDGELRENTWQYQAALSVMPLGFAPKPKFTNDGLKAAGWTLPATTSSMLAMIGCFAAAYQPRRRPDAMPTPVAPA